MLICLWSGPRNVSTALMYSFAQRKDVTVVDEPLYGHYLKASGADHPAANDVMRSMDCNGDAVMQDLLDRSTGNGIWFAKHMAHHLMALDETFLARTTNVLLLRNPRDMLPSLNIQLPNPTLRDTGLKRQWQLFEQLTSLGQTPAVLDAQQLLADPRSVLRQLCAHIGIEFESAMLQWPAGPREEDGVWAPHWYHNVHKSTGFGDYHEKHHIDPKLKPLLDRCAPYYDKLLEQAIRQD